ncbi:cupin domain-containing protein [Pelagicoccus mobilis]|uniref:Cupin domain-containing protein n=1 Tax=Pelagicoccus mobilis TaxID=415221 RepID=A0A934VPW0_9BACT|nr:cupin domain-containing protein [Pelagicoccus mobilis]MBK1875914.1 cupin domain-containing protein [Pelagicoccus mobilis]
MSNLNLSQKSTGLIGGLGMTRVDVYDQRPGPDGKMTGSPHIHAVCSEAYYVLEGEGMVEIHTLEAGWQNVELKPGVYFQFPPKALHRLVSHDGLAVLGIMSNAGLAENGDARIYFGEEVDSSPEAYAEAVGLTAKGIEGALERRDLAVEAYQNFLTLWEEEREAYFAELKRFIELHERSVLDSADRFLPYVQEGPKAWGAHTERLLGGTPSRLPAEGFVRHEYLGEPRLGMCGTLQTVQVEGVASSGAY